MSVPLVCCQCADESNTMDAAVGARFLNVYNIHQTGHMHGIFPAHIGMRVRLTQKINATLGLVQEQRATIVDIVFHPQDAENYRRARPGELFRPRFLPAGFWLQVDDFSSSPIWEQLLPTVEDTARNTIFNVDDSAPGPSMKEWRRRQQEKRAKGMFFLPAMETECTFKSTDKHTVRRAGFVLTHANFLTATASQGQTIRTGVTIDCARIPQANGVGMSDDNWWLNLYVMFSRVTRMSDMLLLRPPPREFLERDPPACIKEQLDIFAKRIENSSLQAEELAHELGFELPLGSE